MNNGNKSKLCWLLTWAAGMVFMIKGGTTPAFLTGLVIMIAWLGGFFTKQCMKSSKHK